MKYNSKKIGARIADERKKNNFSQDELLSTLSKKYGIGMSRNTLSAIEQGKHDHYDIDFLIALCELFDCEIGYLLCEYDEKRRIVADIKESTGLETDVIKVVLNMKNSFLKMSILNDLLKDKYFLAIIDSLYHIDYHCEKSIQLDKIETRIKADYDDAETLEEKNKFDKRYKEYRKEQKFHDESKWAYRYRIMTALSRLLDERYGSLPPAEPIDIPEQRQYTLDDIF